MAHMTNSGRLVCGECSSNKLPNRSNEEQIVRVCDICLLSRFFIFIFLFQSFFFLCVFVFVHIDTFPDLEERLKAKSWFSTGGRSPKAQDDNEEEWDDDSDKSDGESGAPAQEMIGVPPRSPSLRKISPRRSDNPQSIASKLGLQSESARTLITQSDRTLATQSDRTLATQSDRTLITQSDRVLVTQNGNAKTNDSPARNEYPTYSLSEKRVSQNTFKRVPPPPKMAVQPISSRPLPREPSLPPPNQDDEPSENEKEKEREKLHEKALSLPPGLDPNVSAFIMDLDRKYKSTIEVMQGKLETERKKNGELQRQVKDLKEENERLRKSKVDLVTWANGEINILKKTIKNQQDATPQQNTDQAELDD
ncbi:hypothetical protein RFI_13533 [Reticulomyxa filosa]|uniref:Uncharacterized protein n=1 Tax=Reticulomyxa filosa TaxID=46433 RepID=X6NBH9_RETFI|nr:hypothetical protein RFI_13533 [Reticulomyxa filosa]|eukprot:ETO23650.1 hypothetical protein RFI_13533 [Reticulomyxa filosa]